MKNLELSQKGIKERQELKACLLKIKEQDDTIKTNKKTVFYNIPCAFDTETTSFYENGHKRAIMYEWTLGLNGSVFVGRTWKDLLECFELISTTLELNEGRRLIIYVHNLSFEFQFMKEWLSWTRVFAVNDRKPVQAISTLGIEFRCSYILSGYSLALLGKNLRTYKVQKMEGDLDYKLLRNSATPLTEKEWGYCENDVRVVMAYIQECIEADGDISRIPLTKTGYVRNYCRNACMYEGSHKNSYKFLAYHRLMMRLMLDPDEYEQLKRAFQGGFTHANALYSDKLLYDVASFDFTSSYPAVMISEKFPMSKAEIVKPQNKEQFYHLLNNYCCLFDIEFIGLEGTSFADHPLSISRCYVKAGVAEDNGRVIRADRVVTTITEQDFFILEKFYTWKEMKLGKFRRYKRGYLPTDFVKAILKLYENKTTLKNVAGQEDEYMRSKEMINSCYGMCVTDICRDESCYDGSVWYRKPCDINQAIKRNNNSKKRFLFFPWGVWVTAYARRNLFTGISEFNEDYVYSDTDSVKVLNYEKHRDYISEYNELITLKIEKALEFHGLPREAACPKTCKGVPKPLGVWDFEGVYSKFKTLGAKRYMVEKDGELNITVSGVNKKVAVPYLLKKYGKEKVFDAFEDELYIPPDYTGKMTHTYLDDEMQGELTDYLGNKATYNERSGVHLENADYSLSLSQSYFEYLMGIREHKE